MAHDIEMDSFPDEEESRYYAPPPHIAARFYRKSSSRRKSSTHSSRRSSISSRHSTLSAHGGPQSNHVAQHLRRASIIESRKARLADRAAHAEQVRLRAAIAKATPRAVYREERALAAQAAREKLLAEITARCEEEVKRAKKIAEETKEKKAAEHARLKEEMAEKLAEATRRRSMYQRATRRPRGPSLPSVEEKKVDSAALRQLSEEHAARIIQRAWRSQNRHRALSQFLTLGLSLAQVRDMPFERVGQLLAEERVLRVALKVLKALGLTAAPEARESTTDADRGITRIFLGIYLILGHPLQALSHGGKEPQEQDLIAKAENLLCSFEDLLQQHQASKPATTNPQPTQSSALKSNFNCCRYPAEVDELSALFDKYTSAFHAWKAQDSSALVDIMVNQFVELDLILQTVKDDHAGGVADDYFQAIRHNQIQLLARLKKFAGAEKALTLVRAAVRKARKQRGRKPHSPSEQDIPRSSVSDAPSDTLDGPGIHSSPAADMLKSSRGQVDQIPRQSSSVGPGPSSFVSRLGQTMTVLPTNREISHEIQINGTFEVQQQPWTESRKHFMDSLRSSMRQSMSQGGSEVAASWTHAMAILVRDKLLTLVSRKHPLYDRIDGFLDPKLIDQECRAGLFSYDSFFETIARLIAQICSPGRDEAVRAFTADTTSDAIDRLFALINIIDLMTLDHINFAFRAASSAVVEHGHEHEQSFFEKDLNEGVCTLATTRQWWTNSRSNVASSLPLSTSHGNTIYARGLVDLVLSNSSLSYTSVPETLRLDWLRLLSLRARAFRVVAIASILLTTKIRLRRNREAQWMKDAERLTTLDFGTVEPARIVSVIESSHIMPEATREGLLNFVSRVLPPASAAARKSVQAEQARMIAMQTGEAYDPSSAFSSSTHAEQLPTPADGSSAPSTRREEADVFTEQVATFVLKSLREHVFARLSAASTAEKVRVTTSAAEVLARAGMPEFVAEVGSLVDVLERVKNVDLRAHEKWYDEVAREA
jgi:T-complex protein 11